MLFKAAVKSQDLQYQSLRRARRDISISQNGLLLEHAGVKASMLDNTTPHQSRARTEAEQRFATGISLLVLRLVSLSFLYTVARCQGDFETAEWLFRRKLLLEDRTKNEESPASWPDGRGSLQTEAIEARSVIRNSRNYLALKSG